MATQSYVTELQAAPQASQPPQAPPQALPQPPPPAAPQPPAAATPQPQYVTELQSPQPQTQPPGSQKQYVAELPAAPAPSQPATPAPSPVAQQYIVVTVSGKFTSVLMARVLGPSLGRVWGSSASRDPLQGYLWESGHLWVKGIRPSREASVSHWGASVFICPQVECPQKRGWMAKFILPAPAHTRLPTGPEPLCLGLTITASLNKDK